MTRIKTIIFSVITLVTFLCTAHGSDRSYSDIATESPSKKYRVEAKSPENDPKKPSRAFQSSFVYTFQDTTAKKTLWTRLQAMRKPKQTEKDSTESYRIPEEGSPVAIFVSDAGWTVIRTEWDELIVVDSAGKDRCRIKLLKDGFTKEEVSEYVRDTTAGPMWAGYSLWYFLIVGGKHVFVLRPWWGRRMVLNLEVGKLMEETAEVSKNAMAYEQQFVMTTLANAIKTRKSWEEECCEAVWPILSASYLAGRLPVPEAAPLLEQLQEVSYSGRSTMGGLGSGERFEGEVNPHNYKTFTLRQVVQLSLRRLGKVPLPFAAYQFDVQHEDNKKNHPYIPKLADIPRANNVAKITPGMKAEQVLDFLGAPDSVEYDTWEYDIDANLPYTLILKWDARRVIEVQKKTLAIWKEGLLRDAKIVR